VRPWQTEPDKLQWYDDTTGMACLIVRNHSGALCGYAGVEPGHPWHRLAYHDCSQGGCDDACCDAWCEHQPQTLIQVHGGLTYSAGCQEDTEICHVPAEGRSGHVWWFGFDCAHYGDLIPGVVDLYSFRTYRDIAYVRAEVVSLARQLAELAHE
jgi:hypothetical protein